MIRPVVIGTVAEKGAGKGLFVELTQQLLSGKHVISIRFSDIWREMVALLGKEESREHISTLATAVRNAFHDDGILIPAMRRRLQNTDADVIILDGLRKAEEVALVHEYKGILLYITADPKQRFERRRAHAETTDEQGMSWEQFARQEQFETEISIRTIGEQYADARLDNNGTVEEFRARVRTFLETHGISA